MAKFVYFVALTIAVCVRTEAATVVGQKSARQPSTTTTIDKGKRAMEPAFATAGQQAGLEIWRIEDFKPVAYPKSDYGKFYTGDSYIVLHTKVDKSGHKSWNIHFWLGKETSQDESGAAAILAVALDDQLGGDPVQYREVQEHESQTFASYFKSAGIRYLPGGRASAFRHVDRDAFTPRLYHVKGKRNVRVKQVAPSLASMNNGDCFILDAGRNVHVYVGTRAKRVERLKAIAAANLIRDQDHAGSARVHIVDESATDAEVAHFFQALGAAGSSRADVPEEGADDGDDDETFERAEESAAVLYRVSDARGRLEVTRVEAKPLEQSLLDTNDCFVLAGGASNVFVWIGRKCNKRERSEAMTNGQKFLADHGYASWTSVVRVIEGGETAEFTQYFRGWRVHGETTSRRLIRSASGDEAEARLFHAVLRSRGGAAAQLEEIVDYRQEDLVEDDVMVVDAVGVVYVWVGRTAEVEVEREGALRAVSLYLKRMGRRTSAIQVVEQGREPAAFRELFPAWNDDLWRSAKSYEEMKNELTK